jgi:putative ABC transport system substrate-binding protein
MKYSTILASVGAILMSIGGGLVHAADKVVAVTSIIEHTALDAVRDGVRESLKEAGFVEGKNLRFVFQTAQGSPATAAQIARKYVGDGVDVIVPISTPSAQAVVAATRTIPVVYSAITDPVAAKLVKSWEASGTNVTGVSDLSPIDRHLELVRKIVPQAQRLGVIYSPGEANSMAIIEVLRKEAKASGIDLVEAPAQRTVDIQAAALRLAGKVDAIYAPTDNNVISALEAIVKVAQQAKVPLIAADTDSVKRGATAALGVNYLELGRQTGRMVARVLQGEAPGQMRSEISTRLELHLNTEAASRQGVTLSQDLIKSAAVVIK